MYLRVLFSITFSIILSVQFVQAEMRPLDEQELTGVTGEGVGLVFEDFQYNAANSDFGGDLTFKLTGIEDQSNNPVDVSLSHFYIAGPNSAYGTALDGNVVNLGRLGNPFTIDMLDGNDLAIGTNGWTDKAVLSIAAPTHVDGGVGYDCTSATATEGSGTCSSRPKEGLYHGERMDIGMRLNLDYVTPSKNMNLNLHAQSAHFDGSYLRLWGGDIDVDGDGFDDSTMMMEAQVNFYADKLYIDSCNTDGSSCGNGIEFSQFKLELALGDAEFYQPMTFDVNADGNFTLEIHELAAPPGTSSSVVAVSSSAELISHGVDDSMKGKIADDGLRVGSDPATWDWYNNYYENGRKTNFRVEDMTVGGTNFGNSYISNLQIQHLKVTSHDL